MLVNTIIHLFLSHGALPQVGAGEEITMFLVLVFVFKGFIEM